MVSLVRRGNVIIVHTVIDPYFFIFVYDSSYKMISVDPVNNTCQVHNSSMTTLTFLDGLEPNSVIRTLGASL